MSPTIQMLLWEFWRPIRWRLVVAFFAMSLLPGLVTLANAPWRLESPWQLLSMSWSELRPMPWELQMLTIWVNAVICVLAVGNSVGYPIRHYTLPISTRQLALTRLLPGALTCSSLYLVLASLLNWFCNSGWPYLGPALTYGLGYIFGYAIISRIYGRENLKTLAGLCIAILGGFWIAGHYPLRLNFATSFSLNEEVRLQNEILSPPLSGFGPSFRWPAVSLIELSCVGLVILIAWRITETGFVLDRKGRGWAHPAIRSWESETVANVHQSRLKRFRSPFAALFWQEWRQDGWLWPTAIACTYGLVASISITVTALWPQQRLPSDDVSAIIGVTFAFMAFGALLPWCVGVVTTQGRKSQVDKTLPTSLSTLPVSDATVAWVALCRSLCSVALSWACSLCIGMTWILIYYFGGGDVTSSSFSPGPGQPTMTTAILGGLAWLSFFAWFATGVGASTALSGRSWIAFLPIMFIPLWFGLALAMNILMVLIGQSVAEFLILYGLTGILLALVTGMLASYRRAMSRNVIGMRSLLTGMAILILVEGVLTAYYWQSDFPDNVAASHFAFIWRFGLFLALAAAPPAVAPLAVHFNRHR
ncbi:MAG: hypothetical protein JWM11_4987 [Planctomycetaceae bacterium]|nr:hypothetical protein [Planctomycetaceae bacterium]